jgi:hypothetical protein
MNASPQVAMGADQVIAAIRAWLASGGSEIMNRQMEDARAAADAIVQDMEVPAHILDAPVTY